MGIIKTVLKLAAVLLSGSLVKRLLDSIGYSLGLDLGGLTSLISMVVMAFLTMSLLFPRNYFKENVRRIFKGAFSFLLIWLMSALFLDFFRIKHYTQIGFIAASLCVVFVTRKSLNAKIRLSELRIVCEEEAVQPEDHTILLSLAPVPKVAFLHGFDLGGLLKVLRGKARFHWKLPEDAFMESFEHRQTLKLKGSLSSFVEAVGKSATGNTAILCEAKPSRQLMKVEVASDNPQALEEFKKILKEAGQGSGQGLRQALEEWLSLKPYIMPVPWLIDLNPSRLAGRLLIVGERRDAEDLALQLCLSQLRRNSMAIVVDVKGISEDTEGEMKKTLVERGFKPSKNRLRKKPVKTYRHHGGMEVVFANGPSDEALLKKTLSKPLAAIWFRGLAGNLDVKAPIEILTLEKPWIRSGFEADNIILMHCKKELIESFLPSRGFALERRTVLISQQGVRVLK
ncbi:MAG: hypothetical protein FGF51_03830 [Candidatus Brockarchaeota archaeon]|nr:hypothetical protein [Candidatus Brockarchaeota archaeon]